MPGSFRLFVVVEEEEGQEGGVGIEVLLTRRDVEENILLFFFVCLICFCSVEVLFDKRENTDVFFFFFLREMQTF